MAQNVTIAGASYSDVPSIEVPKTDGGSAVFVDTSDADAAAGDIASGKKAYVNGALVTGTASGGGANLQTKTVTGNGTYTPDEGYDGFSQVDVSIPGLDAITDDKLVFGTELENGGAQYTGTYVGTYNYTFEDVIAPPPADVLELVSGKVYKIIGFPPFLPSSFFRKVNEIPFLYLELPFTELYYTWAGGSASDPTQFRLFVTYPNDGSTERYYIGFWTKTTDGTYKLARLMNGGFSRTLLFFENPFKNKGTALVEWLRDSNVLTSDWSYYAPWVPISYLTKKEVTITENGTTAIEPEFRLDNDDGTFTTNTTYSDGFEKVTVHVNVPVPTLQESKAVTVTENGTTTVTPDEGYDAVKRVAVTVDVAGGGGETVSLTVTASGPTAGAPAVWYCSSDGVKQVEAFGTPVQCLKNSAVISGAGRLNANAGLNQIANMSTGSYVYEITDNVTATLGA